VALSVALLAFALGYVVNGRRSGDVYQHVAAIERFAADPLSPLNPMVATSDPDVGLSPYTLVLGMLSRATGWSGFAILDIAGLALLGLFLVLLPRAARALTQTRGVELLALAFTLTAWGIQPWQYSGYLSLNSIGFMLGYPSMAAWSALLGAVLVAHRLATSPRPKSGPVLGLGALLAFIALTHPITLIGAVPLAAFTVTRARNRPSVAAFVVAAGVAAAIALLWPYYPVTSLLTGGDEYDAANLATYRLVEQRMFLALPGVLVLALRARRDPLDPLALTALVGFAVFALGEWTERWTAGRALPFAMFAAHLAMASWATGRLRAADRPHALIVAGCSALIGAVGLAGSTSGLAAAVPRSLLPLEHRMDPRLASETERFRFIEPLTTPDDVVLTLDLVATRAVPASGPSVVTPGYPTSLVPDREERRRDSAGFIAASPSERRRLIERYSITHVLVPRDLADGFGGFNRVGGNGRYALMAVPQR
jgi:hypothetical protein